MSPPRPPDREGFSAAAAMGRDLPSAEEASVQRRDSLTESILGGGVGLGAAVTSTIPSPLLIPVFYLIPTAAIAYLASYGTLEVSLSPNTMVAYAGPVVACIFFARFPSVVRTERLDTLLIATLALGALLFMRFLFEHELPDARVALNSIGIVLAGWCFARGKGASSAVRALGVFGWLYLAGTVGLGSQDVLDGQRLTGLAGNPNRMVAIILLLAPPAASLLGRRPIPLLGFAYFGLALSPILSSGSAQAVPLTLLCVALIALQWISGAWGSGGGKSTLERLLGLGALMCLLALILGMLLSSSNSMKFGEQIYSGGSGRYELFGVALRAGLENPLLGVGSLHVSDEFLGIPEYSAHNATLTMFSAGGFPAMLLWLYVSLLALHRAFRSSPFGPLPNALGMALATGLVQSVVTLGTLWVLLGLAIGSGVPPTSSDCLSSRRRMRKGDHAPKSRRNCFG